MKNAGAALFTLVMVGLVAGAVIYGAGMSPSMQKLIDQKIQSIKTPTPPIGNLTPVRDLRGTWVSSLRGKGFQLYGSFQTGPGATKIYEDGDIELVIKEMNGNTASGTIRYKNMSVSGSTSVPGYGAVSVPAQHFTDSGAQPASIRVSGTRLDFGSVKAGGSSYTMQGNYTTDLISGTMTANISPYGVIKGEFHLIRSK